MPDDSAHSGPPEETVYGEDALKDSDVTSGTADDTPVHSPTTPEDEGNPGDGTGEGVSGPASGTTQAEGDENDLTG